MSLINEIINSDAERLRERMKKPQRLITDTVEFTAEEDAENHANELRGAKALIQQAKEELADAIREYKILNKYKPHAHSVKRQVLIGPDDPRWEQTTGMDAPFDPTIFTGGISWTSPKQ